MRTPIGKALRFEIFKRDGFRCIYCGATPMQSLLQIDHVVPVATGGTNAPANLATSCTDCNAGKGPRPLTLRRFGTSEAGTSDAQERTQQIRAYLEAQRELHAAQEDLIGELREAWEDFYPEGNTPQEVGSFRRWSGEFELSDLLRAIKLASGGRRSHVNAYRYLCGIIRRWRTEGVQ